MMVPFFFFLARVAPRNISWVRQYVSGRLDYQFITSRATTKNVPVSYSFMIERQRVESDSFLPFFLMKVGSEQEQFDFCERARVKNDARALE
jgi:hypothetical protein